MMSLLLSLLLVLLANYEALVPFPTHPVIGVDYGLRRIGVAVGVGVASRPLPILQHTGNDTEAAASLVQFALGERSSTFVVGLPLNKEKLESNMSAITREFATDLLAIARRRIGDEARVLLWDERYSTKAAEALLIHTGRPDAGVDSVAACVILDDFFAQKGIGCEEAAAAQGVGAGAGASDDEAPPPPRARVFGKPSAQMLKYLGELESEGR